jgi:two-component system cell cycle response regulator
MINRSRPAPDQVQDGLKLSPRLPIGRDVSIEGAIGSGTVRVRLPAWATFGLLIVLLSAVYLGAPMLGWRAPFLQYAYSTVAAVAATAIVVGTYRNRPSARGAWMLIAAGQGIFAIGDVIYVTQYNILGRQSYPGLSDLLYLASYPLMAIGLGVLVRRRTRSWHLPSILDAAILATSAGLIFWVYLIAPLRATSAGSGLAATVVAVAYPLGDLLVLTVALFLVLGAGVRPLAYYLLIGGLAMNLCTDVVYAVQSTLGTYTGGLMDAGWLLAYGLLAVAALHPSMRRIDERSPVAAPDATWARLVALAVASLAAPAVLAVQDARGAELHVPVVVAGSALLFLLVLARMALLVAVQRREAITDSLTGLHTRRFFEESLRVETERVLRHSGTFGVILFDIDHFKLVNDTYGHPGGDRVLCEVAHRLRSGARTGDVVARYGGEEFGILLRDTTAGGLADLAERIRQDVSSVPVAVDPKTVISVTVSGGTASHFTEATADQVVLAADRALYAAKRSGRNRIVSASKPEPASV